MMVRVHSSNNAASSPLRVGGVALAQALRRELDRRERVLDLVRDAARHFAPRLHALDAQQERDVLEEQDQAERRALLVAQRRRGHPGAVTGRGAAGQLELQLEPVARVRCACARSAPPPAAGRRAGTRRPSAARARPRGAGRACSRRRGLTVATAPVGSSDTTPAVMFCEDVLDVAVALLELGVDRLELAGHAVERRDQRGDLLVAAGGGAVVPVALRDLAHALAEALDRHRDALGEVEPEPRRREQHHQGDQQEGDRVAAADRLLEDLELAVLLAPRFAVRRADRATSWGIARATTTAATTAPSGSRIGTPPTTTSPRPSRSVRAKSCPCAKSARSSPRGNGTPRAAMRSPCARRHRTGGATTSMPSTLQRRRARPRGTC